VPPALFYTSPGFGHGMRLAGAPYRGRAARIAPAGCAHSALHAHLALGRSGIACA
jgi:hypothetical protein